MSVKQVKENDLDIGKMVYENVEFAKNRPIRITKIKVTENQLECVVPYHWHRCIEMIVPILNGAEIRAEDEIYRIFPGDYFLVNSQSAHLCRDIYPYLEYQGYIIQVNYAFLKHHCPHFDDLFFPNDLPIEVKGKIYQHIQDMIAASQLETAYAHLVVESQLLLILAKLLQHSTLRTKMAKTGVPQNITNYISENDALPLSVQEIADHYHIAYSSLEKMFQKHFGMSVKKYIASIRLKNAVYQLLNRDEDNITKIAFENGFVNMKSFYKTFKDTYQMTPRDLKKKMNERK